MRINSQRNLGNGWRGQAMAEYMPTLTTIGSFAIVLLFVFGGVVANTFRDVGDCFQDAAENGQVNAACDGDDSPPEVSDNPDPEEEPTEEDTPPTEEPSEEPTEEDTPPTDDPDCTTDCGGGDDPTDDPDCTTNCGGGDDPTDDPDCTTNCGGGEVGDPEATETPDLDCTGDCSTPDETETPEDLACPADVNFDDLAAGTIISNQFEGVTVTTNDPVNHPVMIFNSNVPTGGDTDLGTPNQAFGGPGVGDGGGPGKPGENSVALGNVMIISQDGNTNNPNDHRDGGNITFTFDHATEVSYMYFLDVDDDEDAATVTLYDQGGSELTSARVEVPEEGGHNGVFRVDLNQTGVYRMSVDQSGSGAIASLFFCDDTVLDPNGDDTGDTGTPTEEPPSSAQVIAVGGSANGIIRSGENNRHDFSLTLADGQAVDINLNDYLGSGIDPYLRVYDTSGNLLAENDDTNGTNSEIPNFSVSGGGTVIIEVATYQDRDEGWFELTITEIPTYSFAVTGLTLIDSDSNNSLGSINDGDTINLSGGRSISAETTGDIGSVRFFIDGNTEQTESLAPYAINGDSSGNFNAWTYPAGTYTLTVTPYSQSGGNGDAGGSFSIQITIE